MPATPDPRLSLLDLPVGEARAALASIVAELGEPAFRAEQVLKQVFRRRRRSLDAMTDLPKALRARLAERVRIGQLELSHRAASLDGTVKYLWKLADGFEIESVAIPQERWLSFCVSSQAGCALRCRFCATASLGLQRNLRSGEIVDQVLAMLEDLGEQGRSLSVVFMGMGEPGYNMTNVLAACRLLNDPDGVGIGARHLTISTSGVVPAIRQLASEPLQVRLAVSLHQADQDLRESLMDVAERFPLNELRESLQAYHHSTGRRPTLEYAVMPGLNDRPADARSLAAFADAVGAKINLIPYNPVEGFESPPSSEQDAARFRRLVLESFEGDVMVRQTRGRDIEAACGMLHRARAGAGA
jgi:23S rRNA (adenine2503-C2)-methyltransferase